MNSLKTISQHPLRRLFHPRSVVLVGASDKSVWSQYIFCNFANYGFDGQLFAVNKRGAPAHGLPGFQSCRAIGEPIDCAYFFVPIEGMLEALEDAVAAGVKSGVILTSGFGETGGEGVRLQQQIVEFAEAHGMKLLGPNSLGFANIAERIAVTAVAPPRMPPLEGGVALLSQSGSAISEIASFGVRANIGFSFLAALGNEAQIGLAETIDYLVEDPNTKAIAIFAESIRNTAAFAAAAAKAFSASKPVIILKIGKSPLTAAVAAAHTGSLVGDDKVFDAACHRYGVTRANSIEELILTAGLIAHLGPLKEPSVGVLSISGGACGMIADMAEEHGVSLPPFSPQTVAALREVASEYGATMNPMDITGAAIRDPDLWERELVAIGNDPSIGLMLAQSRMPDSADASGALEAQRALRAIGRGMAAISKPGLLLLPTVRPVNDYMRSVLEDVGIPGVAVGIEHTMRALGKITWWSSLLARGQDVRPMHPVTGSPDRTARPSTERQVLDHLGAFGVPVIPAVVARTAQEAATAAREMGGKVVLKIASSDIHHKTEVGGVRLSLEGDAAVEQAFREIEERVRAVQPSARIDGVIVSPMRSGGVELIVGVARDPQWGPVIVVGLGGVWVEVLKDTALRLLPVTRSDVLEMVNSLRAAKLLQGFRGVAPVDMDALADAVVRIGEAALALGPEVAALEVNPLLASADRVEALDGVVIWSEPKSTVC